MRRAPRRDDFGWCVAFVWTEQSGAELAEFQPQMVPAPATTMSPYGLIDLTGSDRSVLSRIRAILQRLGVDFREWAPAPMVSGGNPTGATLVDLAAPRYSHYADVVGEHPVVERRCPTCRSAGYAALMDRPLQLRFEKRPSDGVILIVNNRGAGCLPAPWLTFAVSAELRHRMAQDSMTAGLEFFDIDIARRGTGIYFGILPAVRLQPAAAPYGPQPGERFEHERAPVRVLPEENCQECGFTRAKFAIYPLYPRPASPADWFLRSPWGAADVTITARVFDWLTGAAWPLVGQGRPSRVKFRRAGWSPDEGQQAFLPAEYQAGGA